MNYLYIVIPLVLIFLIGIRIVRPTHRGLIERFGRYKKLAYPGFHWIIPVVDRIFMVNITEPMVDAEPDDFGSVNSPAIILSYSHQRQMEY